MSAETLVTFPMGGVHPREGKGLTEKLAVETMPAPKQVRLFLKQLWHLRRGWDHLFMHPIQAR